MGESCQVCYSSNGGFSNGTEVTLTEKGMYDVCKASNCLAESCHYCYGRWSAKFVVEFCALAYFGQGFVIEPVCCWN